MANTNKIFLIITSCICVLFLFAVGFNISPMLRGPAPYPPEWQWGYQFTNTLPRIWFPILASGCILLWWNFAERTKVLEKSKVILFLGIIIFLNIALQLSILYFSRGGIGVLISRILLPGENGYFTQSFAVHSISDFFSTFTAHVTSFQMRAADHPPFAVLFFWACNAIGNWLKFLYPFINSFHISHTDINHLWVALSPNTKVGLLLSVSIIILLSTFWVIPLYFFSKLKWGKVIAVRSVVFACIIPGILLFLPLNDVFLPLFSIGSLFFIQLGLTRSNLLYFLLAGLIWSIGLFFSLSLLPVGVVLIMYILFSDIKKNIKKIFFFCIGGIIIPAILFFAFRFNTVEAFIILTRRQADRSYLPWVFYNLYDIIIFLGLPLALSWIAGIYFVLKEGKKRENILFILATITAVMLSISGFSRAEAGRIWLPLYVFIVPTVIAYLSNMRKFTKSNMVLLFIMQVVFILVLQEFWVTLW